MNLIIIKKLMFIFTLYVFSYDNDNYYYHIMLSRFCRSNSSLSSKNNRSLIKNSTVRNFSISYNHINKKPVNILDFVDDINSSSKLKHTKHNFTVKSTNKVDDSVFSLSNDSNEKLNDQIRNICDRIESNPGKRNLLFNTYMACVKFTRIQYGDVAGSRVNMKLLANALNLEPFHFLMSLYREGLERTQYASSNIFNLPSIKELIIYDLFKYDPDYIYDEKYLQTLSDSILFEQIYSENTMYDIDRATCDDHTKLIVYRDNYYDVVEVISVPQNINVNVNTNGDIVPYRLAEKKDPRKHLTQNDLKRILKYIASDKQGFIAGIGGIIISNSFNDDHVYDMSRYDMIYGEGAFHSAILTCISHHLQHADLYVCNNKYMAFIKNNHTYDLIKKCAQFVAESNQMEDVIADILFTELLNNTSHSRNDSYIEIGRLMDKYKIESHELLYQMFTHSAPLGMGVIDYIHNIDKAMQFTLDDAKNFLENRQYHADYIYGKPIKNVFRKKYGETQTIRVQKYDDCTIQGNFYVCLLSLVLQKMDKNMYESE